MSWRINLRIASGSCSPAAPAKVYDRSKLFDPSIRISQFSFARDPATETRHSPGLSLMRARCWRQFLWTIDRHQDFAIQSSLPLHSNFTNSFLPICANRSRRAKWGAQALNPISTVPVQNVSARNAISEQHILVEFASTTMRRCDKADWEMKKAATLVMLQPSAPARKPIAWIHAPSQPLMQSLLSQFQTPTAPRRISRFFRVWLLFRLPCRTDHPAYFGLASFISPILSAVDGSKTKQSLHRCQRNYRCSHEISVNRTVENMAPSHSGAEMLLSCSSQLWGK
jgi:hypothetical protein